MKVRIALAGSRSDVEAVLLPNIAPHLASLGTFCLHQDADNKRMWIVTNIESGRWAACAFSKKDALAAAAKKLGEITPRKLMKQYRIHRVS